MKKSIFVMPLMAISLLASCGGSKPEQVEFMLSSEQQTTVEGNAVTVYVDWKQTDHIIKFESFTFTADPVKENTVSFDQKDNPRPMSVTITFKNGINEDINGTLSFTYEDATAKTKGNSNVNVAISKPQFNRWYTYEDWWNYCSNGNDTSEATPDDIGKEVNVTVYEKVHKVRLIDIDHIEPKEEVAQAHCTFEFMNVITDSEGALGTEWNNKEPETNKPNNYNFPKSTLNDLLNKTDEDNCIFKALPTGLQGVIKEVNKKVGLGSSYSTETSYSTKLFPLAHDEMINNEGGVAEGEGTIYKYYKDHPGMTERIKTAVDDTDKENYWLRSPLARTTGNEHAWYVDDNANIAYSLFDRYYKIAPAFCI